MENHKPEKSSALIYSGTSLAGDENMALDILLLNQAIKENNNSPILRLYNWRGSWLSIGSNQKELPKHWLDLSTKGRFKIVRRPSGGSAVLHRGGLTYALIWPSAPKKRKEAYKQACQWLIYAFSNLGLKLTFGEQDSNLDENCCFTKSSPADLIDANGNKRIGSAQLWKKGCLLQHGELLLDPPAKLWIEIFRSKPPKSAPSSIPRKGLEKVLIKAVRSTWPEFKWTERKFSLEQRTIAKEAASKYSLKINLGV